MKEKLYLGGGYYDAPAVWVKEGEKTGVYFIHRDYLGSILQLADPQGNLVEENSFDAWGCRRDAVTQQPYAEGKAPKLLLGRGFTGHEHLSFFGLVNMNARLYDPVLGRFLSPDPYVQFPDYTQAFNRYSYCLNSPLCYVDENGEFIEWIIGAAIIGGFINVAVHWNSIDNFWQGFGYFGVGAAAGAVGAVTGGAVGGAGFIGGAIGGFVGGASSGFVTGFGNGLVSGSGFANALYAGAGGALYGSVSGAFGGAVIGGATAFYKGQNVWSGQEIAAGRNAFSLKNTPIEVSSPHRVMSPIPDKIPQKAPIDMPASQNEVSNYSVTTLGKVNNNPMMEGKGLIRQPLSIKGYNDRLLNQVDLYHDFPISFDEIIIKEGWSYGSSGNSTMMVAPGTVNGVKGMYTIGINTDTGIIYHRAFYDWNSFGKNFQFPLRK